jgi:hypothetical protein
MADNLSGATDDLSPMFALLPFRITRKEAARSQLDRAILLWFEAEVADLPAIHTLTVAVQGVLTALCRDMKVPISKLVAGIDAQPKRVRETLRSPQNFFKHGNHKQKQQYKDIVSYSHQMTDLFLMDDVETYHRLFGSASVLMVCLALRYSFENPSALPMKQTKAKLGQRLDIGSLEKLRKPDFFKVVLPHMRAIAAELAVTRGHL